MAKHSVKTRGTDINEECAETCYVLENRIRIGSYLCTKCESHKANNMITEQTYKEAKNVVHRYEQQLNKPIVSGSLPTEEQVEKWSEARMKNFSCSPKLYHKMGALDLLRMLKGNDR